MHSSPPYLRASYHKKHGLDRGEHPTVVNGPAEAAQGRHSVGDDPTAGPT